MPRVCCYVCVYFPVWDAPKCNHLPCKEYIEHFESSKLYSTSPSSALYQTHLLSDSILPLTDFNRDLMNLFMNLFLAVKLLLSSWNVDLGTLEKITLWTAADISTTLFLSAPTCTQPRVAAWRRLHRVLLYEWLMRWWSVSGFHHTHCWGLWPNSSVFYQIRGFCLSWPGSH